MITLVLDLLLNRVYVGAHLCPGCEVVVDRLPARQVQRWRVRHGVAQAIGQRTVPPLIHWCGTDLEPIHPLTGVRL